MKEINIAKVLVTKRREKGVTQDELANYIGVSKASVSKWETGQSYPDVTFLPLLAAYFDITIDELMDYQPQMPKENIRKQYQRLSADFAAKPFHAVLEDLRQIIKKYYSCYPLLLQMGILMVNHLELVGAREEQAELIAEAKALFVRVREESGDVPLVRQAHYLEALCCLSEGDANGVLERLGSTSAPVMPPETLLAAAYQMKGLPEEAKAVLQAGIYQSVVLLFNYLPAYMMLCANEPPEFQEALRRALSVSQAFDIKHLHPGVLVALYLSAAQGYVMQGNPEKAADMLGQYADIVTSDIYPLRLKGDGFFSHLDEWLEQLDLGTGLPRDEKTIRRSMADAVVLNPAFTALADDPKFQGILDRLKENAPEPREEKKEGTRYVQ